jgi:hypothetical protein
MSPLLCFHTCKARFCAFLARLCAFLQMSTYGTFHGRFANFAKSKIGKIKFLRVGFSTAFGHLNKRLFLVIYEQVTVWPCEVYAKSCMCDHVAIKNVSNEGLLQLTLY